MPPFLVLTSMQMLGGTSSMTKEVHGASCGHEVDGRRRGSGRASSRQQRARGWPCPSAFAVVLGDHLRHELETATGRAQRVDLIVRRLNEYAMLQSGNKVILQWNEWPGSSVWWGRYLVLDLDRCGADGKDRGWKEEGK